MGNSDEKVDGNTSIPLDFEIENGLHGLVTFNNQTLFGIFHAIYGTCEKGKEIIGNILSLSDSSYTLIKHKEFPWTIENISIIPSCPLQNTSHNKNILYVHGPQEMGREMSFTLRGQGEFTVILKQILRENVFRLEYKLTEICEASKGLNSTSMLRIGCVRPDLCPWPEKDLVGYIDGSSCLSPYSVKASLWHHSKPYDLGPSFSIARMLNKTVTAEVDLRPKSLPISKEKEKEKMKNEKRTLGFAVDGVPLKAYVSGLPKELYFSVSLHDPTTLSFVSFVRDWRAGKRQRDDNDGIGKGKRGERGGKRVALVGEELIWK